jgi:hypothetical protein
LLELYSILPLWNIQPPWSGRMWLKMKRKHCRRLLLAVDAHHLCIFIKKLEINYCQYVAFSDTLLWLHNNNTPIFSGISPWFSTSLLCYCQSLLQDINCYCQSLLQDIKTHPSSAIRLSQFSTFLLFWHPYFQAFLH